MKKLSNLSIQLIADYVGGGLLPWIDESKVYSRNNTTITSMENITWDYLLKNGFAGTAFVTSDTINAINWKSLGKDPRVQDIITNKLAQRDLKYVSNSCDAAILNILALRADKIHWPSMSYNPHPIAISILKCNISLIDWTWITLNINPDVAGLIAYKRASCTPKQFDNAVSNFMGYSTNKQLLKIIKMCTNNRSKGVHFDLSYNDHDDAVDILLDNLQIVYWPILSRNENPRAIKLLAALPKKIDWYGLSSNRHPDALELLKSKPDKICWKTLSRNPSIYTYRDGLLYDLLISINTNTPNCTINAIIKKMAARRIGVYSCQELTRRQESIHAYQRITHC